MSDYFSLVFCCKYNQQFKLLYFYNKKAHIFDLNRRNQVKEMIDVDVN